MTLIFENESGQAFDFDAEETASKVIEAALDYKKCPYEVQVNLILTDNDGIRQINK